MKNGGVVYISETYDDALQFSSILSLEYALKGDVLSELQAAVGEEIEATAEVTPAS